MQRFGWNFFLCFEFRPCVLLKPPHQHLLQLQIRIRLAKFVCAKQGIDSRYPLVSLLIILAIHLTCVTTKSRDILGSCLILTFYVEFTNQAPSHCECPYAQLFLVSYITLLTVIVISLSLCWTINPQKYIYFSILYWIVICWPFHCMAHACVVHRWPNRCNSGLPQVTINEVALHHCSPHE